MFFFFILVSINCFATTTLYLSPSGYDSAAGTSPSTALKTLEGADNKLLSLNPTDDVKIIVASGNYYNQSTYWTFLNGQSITIEASNSSNRPVFIGNYNIPYNNDYFFVVNKSSRQNTNITLRYLKIKNYLNAVSFSKAENNTVFGCVFEDIGTKYIPIYEGYKAIGITSSNNNLIQNNHFLDIENTTSTSICDPNNSNNCTSSGRVHAIYFANESKDNLVDHNYFENNSGDPVRFRNGSSNNDVRGNIFIDVAGYGAFSTWLDISQNECPSSNIWAKFNKVKTFYSGSNLWPGWYNEPYNSSQINGCSDQTSFNDQIHTVANYQNCGGLADDGTLYCDDEVNTIYQQTLNRDATDYEMEDHINNLNSGTTWAAERKIMCAKRIVSFISDACCGYNGDHLHASTTSGNISMYSQLTPNTGSKWSIEYLNTYKRFFFQGTGSYNGQYLAADSSGQLYLTTSAANAAKWDFIDQPNNKILIKQIGSGSNYGKYLVVSTTTGIVDLSTTSSTTGAKWSILNRN